MPDGLEISLKAVIHRDTRRMQAYIERRGGQDCACCASNRLRYLLGTCDCPMRRCSFSMTIPPRHQLRQGVCTAPMHPRSKSRLSASDGWCSSLCRQMTPRHCRSCLFTAVPRDSATACAGKHGTAGWRGPCHMPHPWRHRLFEILIPFTSAHGTGKNRHVPVVSQHSFHIHSCCRMHTAAWVAQETDCRDGLVAWHKVAPCTRLAPGKCMVKNRRFAVDPVRGSGLGIACQVTTSPFSHCEECQRSRLGLDHGIERILWYLTPCVFSGAKPYNKRPVIRTD